jgi:membrane protease YdiL (CAAX protease family)
MDGMVISMLSSSVLIVITIIILTRISGNNMASIFLKKGNIRLGLIIGLAGFSVFAVASIVGANMLFLGQDLSLERVIAWTPWISVFVIANGFREELLYRGLFLKKITPLIGSKTSLLLLALIFAWSHTPITYSSDVPVLVIVTLLLGLTWGYVMQRTDSLLGSILFHAGTDIAVVIGLFANI